MRNFLKSNFQPSSWILRLRLLLSINAKLFSFLIITYFFHSNIITVMRIVLVNNKNVQIATKKENDVKISRRS